jgi:hypothetical protein
MIPLSTSRLVWLCAAVTLAAIAIATLGPAEWVVFRTGIHWLVDHFLAFFAITTLVCLVWPRPFMVATLLMVIAGLLEALQGLTIDRSPHLLSAISGAGGVVTAAFLVWLMQKVARRPALDKA